MDGILGIETIVVPVPMIFCVLMCGGKGTRLKKTMGLDIEKPLIKLKNKALLEYPLNALMQSGKFEKIFAAVSSNTQKTREFIESNYGDKVTLIETTGMGYSEDYLLTIKYFKEMENEKKCGIKKILFLPIDIPLISLNALTQLIAIDPEKPCLTIVLEEGFVKSVGMLPSEYGLVIDSKNCCYSGISIVDIKKVDMDMGDNTEGFVTPIDEEYKTLNRIEIACNTNTLEDLKTAEKFLDDVCDWSYL
jgi:GTP:adenosylcobinamide-phosphate guanylyltransferase